jgi:hypothetical protein
MDKGRWESAWSAKLACTEAHRNKKIKRRLCIAALAPTRFGVKSLSIVCSFARKKRPSYGMILRFQVSFHMNSADCGSSPQRIAHRNCGFEYRRSLHRPGISFPLPAP